MKKIIISLVSLAVVAISISSCSKTADGGSTTPPVEKTKATIVANQSSNTVSTGDTVLLGNYTYTVVDSANVSNVHALITGTSSTNISNVFATIIQNGNVLYNLPLSSYGNQGANTQQDFLFSWGKNTFPGVYTVNVYARVTSSATKDSITTILMFDCNSIDGLTSYGTSTSNASVKDIFVNGNLLVSVSPNTPITKNVQAGQTIESTRIMISAIGKDYSPSYMEVVVTNPAMVGSIILQDSKGTKLGTGSIANGIAKISVSNFKVLKNTTDSVMVFMQLNTISSQTGVMVGTTVTTATYVDNFGKTIIDQNDYAGNGMYVYKTLFSITGNNTTKQITPGVAMSLYDMTIRGTGTLKQITYKITWNQKGTDTLKIPLQFFEGNTNVTNVVYFTNQNGDTITYATPTTTAITVTYMSGLEESQISSSTEYILKGICVGFNTNGSGVRVDLVLDAQYVNPGAISYVSYLKQFQVSLNGTVPALLLSDASAAGHNAVPGLSTTDWFSSYLIDAKNMVSSTIFK
ncbi:MAG: hypothetical protein WCQ32_03565 [bacterium]